MTDALTQLKTRLGEVSDLNKAIALLSWDQQTYMPRRGGGRASRAARPR